MYNYLQVVFSDGKEEKSCPSFQEAEVVRSAYLDDYLNPRIEAGTEAESNKNKKTKSKRVKQSDAPIQDEPKSPFKKTSTIHSNCTIVVLEHHVDATLLPQSTRRSRILHLPESPSLIENRFVNVDSVAAFTQLYISPDPATTDRYRTRLSKGVRSGRMPS
ncbi:hypothetical protein BLNAU_16204 [Blattamonas nauphoetae]|uniref:Uncharacterized protein n=1 Tax=Blattamonas nauphoetae TaxID=2049346 RepID=A0ABQ9X8H5_9EUKA|nr:hypothetical protein BLNAU_16204 [Blattamonas nauphoetae]